jgi:NTP pyrophosphatase (non-canonical NTP hydrolase)
MVNIRKLLLEILRFRDARDWSQFHSPKDIAAALSIEASELQELFLWKTANEIGDFVASAKGKNRLAEEIADILIYLLLFSHEVGIDPVKAAQRKVVANAKKYPVDLSKGTATKYTDLQGPENRQSERRAEAAGEDKSTMSRQQSLFPTEQHSIH